MIVLVTGGREFADKAGLWRALSALPIEYLVVGDCPSGADKHARDWYEDHKRTVGSESAIVEFAVVRAAWILLGRRAGPERNGRMVGLAKRYADAYNGDTTKVLVLACPGGKGTADCVRRARLAGLTVKTLDEVLGEQP